MNSQNALMGPLGMIDFFGIPLVRDTWHHRDKDDALQGFRGDILASLELFLSDGKLGMKSGSGFYRYPDPSYQQADFAARSKDSPVSPLLQTVLIAHAVVLAADQIAQPADIDRAWCIGMQLANGPFQQLSDWGSENLEPELQALVELGLTDSEVAIRVQDWIKQ